MFFLKKKKKKKKHLETKDSETEVFHQENNVNFTVAEEVKEAKAAPCPAVIGDRHTKARAALEANSRTPTGWGGGGSKLLQTLSGRNLAIFTSLAT